MIIDKKRGKLEPNWEGPFLIGKAFLNKTYPLVAVNHTAYNARFLNKKVIPLK